MYPIDDRGIAVTFGEAPQHSPRAPMPMIVTNDLGLLLVYEVAPDGAQLVFLWSRDSQTRRTPSQTFCAMLPPC
jgi:hypothetical protein